MTSPEACGYPEYDPSIEAEATEERVGQVIDISARRTKDRLAGLLAEKMVASCWDEYGHPYRLAAFDRSNYPHYGEETL